MKQLWTFFSNHWQLTSSLVVIIVLLVIEEYKSRAKHLTKLTPQAAILLINREKALVIDLRSATSFDTGHIVEAINIEKSQFMQTYSQKLQAYKNRPLILADEGDGNLTVIMSNLKAAGFNKIYILAGGVRAWQQAALPLIM